MEKKKIAVAMSGGVDSSLTAALLKEQGHEVIGITMELSDCSAGAIQDAKAVADFLAIPHYVANFRELFQQKVIDYFLAEYGRGRTPNPCVACNPNVKFGGLIGRAKELGYDYLATGHYAQIGYNEATGRYDISKGTDDHKDQAYALYRLTQEQLAHIMTPLGGWVKTDTRREAAVRNLPVANKPESQEICFVPDDYKDYLLEHRPDLRKKGDIVDTEGHVLGNNSQVFAKGLIADKLNWVAIDNLREPMEAKVKIRYGAREAAAMLYPQEDGKVKVEFREPARAITPGQSAVFYIDQRVLGGGIIEGGF